MPKNFVEGSFSINQQKYGEKTDVIMTSGRLKLN